ncbi:hypothetical protein V5F53_21755, partial [Xanthobacter sp. V4C-4]|uniref:hypothetical protein n=1 Tax=Xanthobacter cornucopiae TaxID=3119924 RepID=UPI003726E6F1
SPDPDGARIRTGRFSTGWRATAYPHLPPRLRARSNVTEAACFEVEAHSLLVGLRAGPGGASVGVSVDGVRRDVFVRGVLWYDIGQHVEGTAERPTPAA